MHFGSWQMGKYIGPLIGYFSTIGDNIMTKGYYFDDKDESFVEHFKKLTFKPKSIEKKYM